VAELQNTFTWSFSAAEDFEQCRRKRYWAKYGMWGGWAENATPQQRAAYRLGKMENGHSLLGQAVETAALWVIRQHQAGATVTADQAYEAAARPFLNRAWKESKDGGWRQSPKKYCCLKEFYYHELDADAQRRWVDMIVRQSRQCLATLLDSVLPRIAQVHKEQEIPIATPAAGDPEHFHCEGIKIYAIPDYVYRQGPELHIHDWKAGKVRERHQGQLSLYGLWAHVNHQVPPGQIHVHIEYLADGHVDSRALTAGDLELAKAHIAESVREMAEYLVDSDIGRNIPCPKEEWEMAAAPSLCRLCNFRELCAPELAED
jgi:hypothetical protein